MHTRIIHIGNSQGIILPEKFLQQCHLAGEVALRPTPEGLLLVPAAQPARQNWEARMQAALATGPAPAGELLEGFTDPVFENDEWQW